jgi:hypothetical protein
MTTIYTGVKMTINGVLDERIEVTFNTSDGNIGLRFHDDDTEGTQEYLSFAAAKQLIKALETAFFMRQKGGAA